MTFHFILVNYNNSKFSIDCVQSILNQGDYITKVYIVDNNSRTEEKEKLSSWVGENRLEQTVTLVFLSENIGYFPAIHKVYINIYPLIEKKDLLFIGNNDLLLDRDFLKIISTRTYPNDVFVISPNIINRNNIHQNPAVEKRYSKLQLFYLKIYHYHYIFAWLINLISHVMKFRGSQKGKKSGDKSGYISIGYGACYILTYNYVEKIKEIPHYVFLMHEEITLSDIVFENGGKIYYDKELIIHHMEHASVLKVPRRNIYHIGQESYRKVVHLFAKVKLYDEYRVK